MVNVKLADISVEMDNRFPDLAHLCAGYETDEETNIHISVSDEELEMERRAQIYDFPVGYLETVCMYRKLALEMLKHDVFIMHASVLEVDGEGYAFLAPSGTGKTTQTRLWLEHFGDRARVVNGDKPLIRVEQDGEGWKFIAYGTPWNGKEGMGCNASVKLKALYMLERAPEPECVPAPEAYSIDRLFRQMLMPEKQEQMEMLLSMADRLIESLPVYILRCNMKTESVIAAYEAAQR